jgi:hypothetical protein
LRKTIVILFLILNGGCTIKRFIDEKTSDSDKESVEKIIDVVKNNNISKVNYFIVKGEFSVKINNKLTRLLFSLKHLIPDKYLLSIKSRSGIEGARIYLIKDSVLINERIGKKLLVGTPKDLEKITGIPFFIMNMAFGDLLLFDGNEIAESERINNIVRIQQQHMGKIWNSFLDTNVGKVKSAEFLIGDMGEKIKISYSKFQKTERHVPEVIVLKDPNKKMKVEIRIKRIEIPWDGDIEFIPGKGYVKEEI